jgi:hypothetical protein
MNRIIYGLLFLIIAGGISSCSFHKLIKGKVPKIQTTADSGMAKSVPQPQDTTGKATHTIDSIAFVKHMIETVAPLWKNRLSYNTFSGKAKVHIVGPDGKFEFVAHFRIRKDSVVWIEADAMGGLYRIRILITQDSISMINYAQKEVTRMPLSQAAKILPAKVDFSALQNLITGEPLREGNITMAKSIDGLWAIQVEDSSYIQHITYSKQDSTMHTGELLTRDPFGPRAMSEYSMYDTTSGKRVSTSRMLEIRNGNDIYTLDLNFQKIDFDSPLDFPFNIPKNYSVKE